MHAAVRFPAPKHLDGLWGLATLLLSGLLCYSVAVHSFELPNLQVFAVVLCCLKVLQKNYAKGRLLLVGYFGINLSGLCACLHSFFTCVSITSPSLLSVSGNAVCLTFYMHAGVV